MWLALDLFMCMYLRKKFFKEKRNVLQLFRLENPIENDPELKYLFHCDVCKRGFIWEYDLHQIAEQETNYMHYAIASDRSANFIVHRNRHE